MDYLGLSFDQLDEQAVAALLRGRRADMGFAYLVTPNVDHVVRLSKLDREGEEWRAYRMAAWRLCDSRVLALLAAFQGIRLPVVAGSDLTARLLSDIVEAGDRVCLIGGREGDVATLARLRPDIDVVQHIPPPGLREDRAARIAAARFAADSGARFVLIAVGSPQQELIAAELAIQPGARGTALCIGASIDFLSGRATRAPRWMRRLALEWLHRLLSNPRRLWRRYLVEGPAILLLAWRFRR
ncbi:MULTISPECIES: WecB/TagA/CpsF family glycosyltransferase [unclassified Sphingomonas]|uniref:WecB/TagA/CpsF family glycosyltransferase n=1 Tax=unclassified Sphingomonas TaxID=196159 RepID=UPI0006FAAEB7|nr:MULTISPECIES: WecB/TagA/CpsF family glycosyltransferase [unclassified Sphingomonas]KQX26337.1 glycosyl transferase [Sphingomonas sp. Root1294]KQY69408.1 glycosyl transferase [Sphingomonas sp. Root50]KRB89818.1 glycosyl transferase [Sphingomonas sp. Root720]